MTKEVTSLRLDANLRAELGAAAAKEGLSVTELIERFVREGLATANHPGIFFNPGPAGRRAVVAGGPDVWEVIGALRSARGSERARVRAVAHDFELHERQVVIALDYAADHPDEIEARIRANDEAFEAAERSAKARARLLK